MTKTIDIASLSNLEERLDKIEFDRKMAIEKEIDRNNEKSAYKSL